MMNTSHALRLKLARRRTAEKTVELAPPHVAPQNPQGPPQSR